MGKAVFMVRAHVADAADRPAFDRWYETEHLPDALRILGADGAWRCWSEIDPTVHYAFYAFASVDAAKKAVVQSDEIRSLIAEFDRVWPRVIRSREILEVVQTLESLRTRTA
jgi:hypothetical protein